MSSCCSSGGFLKLHPHTFFVFLCFSDKAEPPLKGGGNLLLTKEFLEECSATYSIHPLGQDSNQLRAFQAKFLNVLDPIRETNNLGRSVSQGECTASFFSNVFCVLHFTSVLSWPVFLLVISSDLSSGVPCIMQV